VESLNEVTLLDAVVALHAHKKKSEALSYTIRFHDVSRTCIIAKQWSKVGKKWNYVIKESFCPGLVSGPSDFIGNLANVPGIRFGGNVPGYKVFKDQKG
jgi:hypothetical protein